jgi:hypothetical protein
MGKTITSIVTLTVAIILTYASTASAGGFTSDPVKTDRAYIKDHYITKQLEHLIHLHKLVEKLMFQYMETQVVIQMVQKY